MVLTPTLGIRCLGFFAALLITTAIFALARLIHQRTGRNDQTWGYKGSPICYWLPICHLLFSIGGLLFCQDLRYLMTYGIYGVLVGFIISNLHDWVVARRLCYVGMGPEPSAVDYSEDLTNPYLPPRCI